MRKQIYFAVTKGNTTIYYLGKFIMTSNSQKQIAKSQNVPFPSSSHENHEVLI